MPKAPPLQHELTFEYGVCEQVAPLIRRVIARNPGPFTYYGTGTYIIGQGEVAVIDPGPALSEHVDAIVHATRGERISHILITHTHRDHSPACRLLQQICDAPSYGFGAHGSGKEAEAAEADRVSADRVSADRVEEGIDWEFQPDIKIKNGELIQGQGWTIECVYTPGHTSNHMCYQLRETKALFSGDHVMGWSTSVVIPPDGDLGLYLASLEYLLPRDDQVYWPTHGAAIREPKKLVQAFIGHRHKRLQQILECIDQGNQTIPAMVKVIYPDLAEQLHPAASRSTLAGLIYLQQKSQVQYVGKDQSVYERATNCER